MKFNFGNMTDAEVLSRKNQLSMYLESKLTNMVYDDELDLIYEELEAIEQEIEERDI